MLWFNQMLDHTKVVQIGELYGAVAGMESRVGEDCKKWLIFPYLHRQHTTSSRPPYHHPRIIVSIQISLSIISVYVHICTVYNEKGGCKCTLYRVREKRDLMTLKKWASLTQLQCLRLMNIGTRKHSKLFDTVSLKLSLDQTVIKRV